VFLSRRPEERSDADLQHFYKTLLTSLRERDFKEGEWSLCERTGWPDNQSFLNVVAWCCRKDDARHLIVVNLSDQQSQAQVRLPWDDVRGRSWSLTDAFTGQVYERDGTQMREAGLYVDLNPWGYHLLKF
jgi:hypothetical protein